MEINNPRLLADYHVHSTFSDGHADPAAVVEEALGRGITRLGFSEHSYTEFDLETGMPPEKEQAYRDTIAALQREYAGRIQLYCGIEQDILSGAPSWDWDYIIGSVHYLYGNGCYYAVDYRPGDITSCRDELFGGDIYALCEAYYESVSQVCKVTGCTVVGHFDLIKKLNERCHLFDPTHPRYRAAWQRAADILLKADIPFEINTGGVSRGYCESAYPSEEQLCYLSERGARFLLSSDSHDPKNLCFGFEKELERAQRLGLKLVTDPFARYKE